MAQLAGSVAVGPSSRAENWGGASLRTGQRKRNLQTELAVFSQGISIR